MWFIVPRASNPCVCRLNWLRIEGDSFNCSFLWLCQNFQTPRYGISLYSTKLHFHWLSLFIYTRHSHTFSSGKWNIIKTCTRTKQRVLMTMHQLVLIDLVHLVLVVSLSFHSPLFQLFHLFLTSCSIMIFINMCPLLYFDTYLWWPKCKYGNHQKNSRHSAKRSFCCYKQQNDSTERRGERRKWWHEWEEKWSKHRHKNWFCMFSFSLCVLQTL